jgi:dihydrofolate reductase
MRKIIVTTNMTLNGVTQAPGRSDEDLREGFTHGGWMLPYADDVQAAVMGRGMAGTDAMLFGRRTYEDFFSVWPHRTDNPFTPFLNRVQKYVASNTLSSPLPWENSTLLEPDVMDAVVELKKQPGGNLSVIGSIELVQSLAHSGLVDQYVLLIHPLILSSGRRLFANGVPSTDLRLVESIPTTTGVIISTYEPR